MRVQPVSAVQRAASDGPAGAGASDEAMPVPSTLRSPRARRAADSGSFPPLTAPLTVRARRFAGPAGASPDGLENGPRAVFAVPWSFPHGLAAPAFGAILTGLLTYCLHQWGVPTAGQARLVRARTTYGAQGPVAEPVRFDVELAEGVAQVTPAAREAPSVASRAAAVPSSDGASATPTRRVIARGGVEPSPLPVVRPNELRLAREQPSRAFKATSRTKRAAARAPASGPHRPRTRPRD